MQTVGIICEYNPFHLGHRKQFSMVRQALGEDTAIVCLMSGNFVQRGAPAIFDKSLRARAAICAGADLVLELPVTAALSSAEGFAAGGVGILGKFCDWLCFGCETEDEEALTETAKALLSDHFPPLLKSQLEKGLSFPAARAAALEEMGPDASMLSQPNNILAVEYCKAMLRTGTAMRPMPILRRGSYHALEADRENPSATSLRARMLADSSWSEFVPEEAVSVFEGAPLHSLEAGQRAMLAKLRTMTDDEFKALPFGSEGLWRKFMHACRSDNTLEESLAATKSKRYTRSRLDRMAMCAFLGITKEMLEAQAPYVRVLALNDRGRSVLKVAKQHMTCINPGERFDHPYRELEQRCGDLYGLFCLEGPEAPGAEQRRRVWYHREVTP